MRTFLIADTHFGDENIRLYEERPFADTREMDEALIENWNRVVSNEDEVYLVGDVGDIECATRLQGKKYLIKGNHDTEPNEYYRNHGFIECYDKPVIINGFFILSHEPLYVCRAMPYANIFGHVHANPNYKSVSDHGFCVSAERINYTPIDLEDIVKAIKEAKGGE